MVPELITRSDFEQMYDPGELADLSDRWRVDLRASQSLRFHLYEQMLRHNLSRSPESVLDVACGPGHVLTRLRRLYPRARLFGADISQHAINYCRDHAPSGSYIRCALPERAFPDRSFDLICATEVLYYLPDTQQREALRQFFAALRPGGWLLVSGGLDGGRSYFCREGIQNSIARQFELRGVRFNHARLHNALERPLLSRFNRCIRWQTALGDPSAPLLSQRHQWLAKSSRYGIGRCCLQSLLKVNIVLLRAVLGNYSLAGCCQFATRVLYGSPGQTQIVILARKREKETLQRPSA